MENLYVFGWKTRKNTWNFKKWKKSKSYWFGRKIWCFGSYYKKKFKKAGAGRETQKDPLAHSSTLEERVINRTKPKEIIARKIIENIQSGETVFFDITSINYIAAEYLANSQKEITLITNMPSITTHFNKNSKIIIIMIGGEYNKEIGGNVGIEAINYIKKYNVDKAFVGSAGIDLEAGKVMNFEANDGNTKKEIMNISKKIFLATEYRKLGILGNYKFSNLSDFDTFICEKDKKDFLESYKKIFDKSEVEIL